jgi:hypothetical protein
MARRKLRRAVEKYGSPSNFPTRRPVFRRPVQNYDASPKNKTPHLIFQRLAGNYGEPSEITAARPIFRRAAQFSDGLPKITTPRRKTKRPV